MLLILYITVTMHQGVKQLKCGRGACIYSIIFMKSLSCFFPFDMGYNKKKYSFFSSNYEQGGNKYVPKCNYTFYFQPPSTMQLRVSHYFDDVMLHFTKSSGMNKQDRYLPMRESEYIVLSSMVDEISKQIKKTKKK